MPEMPSLTPAAFHILLARAGGERHGYGIMQEVLALTGGAGWLGPGTLYGTVGRLLATGLITEVAERPDPALRGPRAAAGPGRVAAAARPAPNSAGAVGLRGRGPGRGHRHRIARPTGARRK